MPAFAAAVLSALYLAAMLVVLAPRKAGYSHVRHSISELGEAGAPQQRLVGWGVFAPVGIALALVAWAVRDASPPTAALAACLAIGYVGAALFPCDPGSPVWGSPRQWLHNLAGGVEYGGGGFALMTLARDLGPVFEAAGFVSLAAVAGLTLLPAGTPRGLLQRAAEIALFGALALALWRVA